MKPPANNRLSKTFKFQFAEDFAIDQIANSCCNPLCDEDFICFGFIAKPSGLVHDRTDRRVIDAAIKANPPNRSVSVRNPDAKTQLMSKSSPLAAKLTDSVPQIYRKAHTTGCMIRYFDWVIKDNHQTVAEEAIKRAFILFNDRPGSCMVVSQHSHDFFWLCDFRECSKPA